MLKQNFADQLKAQSEIWREQTKDYQERLEQAERAGARRVQEGHGADASHVRKKRASSPKRCVARTRRLGRTWSRQTRRRSRSSTRLGGSGFPFPVIDTKRRTATKRRIQG